MDKTQTGGAARAAERSVAVGGSGLEAARGAVHSFVDIAELRRIMGRLTAIELLQMLLVPDAPPLGA
ncbi:MAG TPA: hypothetical protein VGP64_11600 [Polyangia bacterium]|jgi:hypothetical protein